MTLDTVLASVSADPLLWSDFNALCDAGGRLAGSSSESSAFTFAAVRMAAIGPTRNEPAPYAGWLCHEARVIHEPSGEEIPCAPLLGTMPCQDLVLKVKDLGRGAPGHVGLDGLAVLARHEYPFATHTIHRRVKLNAAREAGAAAFLIVQPEPGVGPVSGSSGRAGGPGIPALGIGIEGAARLLEGGRVRISIAAEDRPMETPNLILEIPGRGPEYVVLSAHLDGHSLAESALDNATGVAAALAMARAVRPFVTGAPRGLMLCIFGAEEWALAGSRSWLGAMDPERRDRMAFNLNLDSIAGSPKLTALTSGFAKLPGFLTGAVPGLGVHEPLMPNSDHANFAAHGIPATRIVAGFNEPESRLRLLLTGADKRRLAPEAELRAATLACTRMLWEALMAPELDLRG